MSKPKHHIRQKVCSTRAPYRDGRKPTAVKVYTIHHESKYIIVEGVPSVGVSDELVKLFETTGDIDEHKILDEYPCEQFTDVHLIKYKRIQSARFAKRKFDDWSFYGGVLHVYYVPEFETVQETREKLRGRRHVVEIKTRQYKSDGTYSQRSQSVQDDSRKTDQHQQTASVKSTCADVVNGTDNNYGDDSARHGLPFEENLDMTGQPSQNISTQQSDVYSDGRCQGDEPGITHVTPHQDLQSYDMYAPVLNFTQHTSGGNHDGSIKQLSRKTQWNQVSSNHASSNQTCSYAEQVIQQARSLQHYGRSTAVTKEVRTKRPGLDTVSNKGQSDQITQNETVDNEEHLYLPPPPKQAKFSHLKKSQKYGGAKVPSAQATFPADFDARTDRHKVLVDSARLKEPEGLVSDLDQKSKNSEVRGDQNEVHTKTMQEKVEENLKNKDVVIKNFSKAGTVPKFIPRQTHIKMKLKNTSGETKCSGVATKADELNQEIRKNAFKLGKAQGPADLGPSTSNQSLDPKEKSVMDSTLEIRKKLIKVKPQDMSKNK